MSSYDNNLVPHVMLQKCLQKILNFIESLKLVSKFLHAYKGCIMLKYGIFGKKQT